MCIYTHAPPLQCYHSDDEEEEEEEGLAEGASSFVYSVVEAREGGGGGGGGEGGGWGGESGARRHPAIPALNLHGDKQVRFDHKKLYIRICMYLSIYLCLVLI